MAPKDLFRNSQVYLKEARLFDKKNPTYLLQTPPLFRSTNCEPCLSSPCANCEFCLTVRLSDMVRQSMIDGLSVNGSIQFGADSGNECTFLFSRPFEPEPAFNSDQNLPQPQPTSPTRRLKTFFGATAYSSVHGKGGEARCE